MTELSDMTRFPSTPEANEARDALPFDAADAQFQAQPSIAMRQAGICGDGWSRRSHESITQGSPVASVVPLDETHRAEGNGSSRLVDFGAATVATPGVCGSGEPSGQPSEPMAAQSSQKENRAHDCSAIGTCLKRQRARPSAVSLRSAVRPLRPCRTGHPHFCRKGRN